MLHWVSKVRYILGCCPRQDMLQCWSHVQCWVPRARAALSGSVAASWCAGPRRRAPSVSPGLGWAGSIVRLWSYEWSSASPASAQPRTSVWWDHSAGRGVSQWAHEARVVRVASVGAGAAVASGGGPATWQWPVGPVGRQWVAGSSSNPSAAVSWHLHLTSYNFQVFTSCNCQWAPVRETIPSQDPGHLLITSSILAHFWHISGV